MAPENFTQIIGRLLMVAGAALLVFGLVFYFSGRLPGLGLGRLPGDIRIERENYRVYIPLGTCLLISIIGTLIWSLISYFGRR